MSQILLVQLYISIMNQYFHLFLYSPPPVPHRIHPQNTHSMRTRGKHDIGQPRIHPSLLLTHVELTSYKHAL